MESLVGAWRLASWTGTGPDGTVVSPVGEAATGMLLLTEEGWFSVQVGGADRRHSAAESPLSVPDDELAEMARTYVAYAGSYEVEEDHVIFTGSVALFPNWVGLRQERAVEFDGDTLILRPPPMSMGDETYEFELRWHRLVDEVVDSMGG